MERCKPTSSSYRSVGEYPKRKILSGVNDMTEQKLKQLLSLLNEYYKEKSKTCEFNCFGCDLAILKGCGYGPSCSIDVVVASIENELYP